MMEDVKKWKKKKHGILNIVLLINPNNPTVTYLINRANSTFDI